MPLYEYQCSGCDERFEALQRIGDDGKDLTCPACGKRKPNKVFSSFAAGSAAHGAPQGAAPAGPHSCQSGGFG